MPHRISPGQRKRPIEQITHVGKNLRGMTPCTIEVSKIQGRIFKCTDGAVGQGRERVP